ncbi:Gfo/Idh/MocA family protein [Bauldia sp.]|uniref:Gfo/Idh/MocA family protein n=1 Tax=Bauldia sp. TaxID=2575872 RepID=UPI003BA890EA
MKIAIIGTGRVAELHAAGIEQVGDDLLAGAWNRTAAKGDAFGSRFGCKVYGELDDLLADPEIDAVVVTVATPTHHDVAKRALEAGKHVLLEKPLSEAADEVRDLRETAKRTNRICMPSHNYIYAEDVRRLKYHTASGDLGEVASFWVMFNRVHPSSIGTPDFYMMRELLVHHAYIMLHFLGRPSDISATGTNVHFDDPNAIDQVMITATYDSGTIANLWGSFAVDDRSRDPWTLVVKAIGSKGTGSASWSQIKYGEEPEPFWDDAGYRDSFLHVERYFIEQCLGRGAAPLSTLDDGVDTLTIVETTKRAIEEGKKLRVDYGD